ncbi:MAG TPA: transcription termination/antitermination NusG family protein [Gemmatimonadaceae bacterium]|nr:transcription termination/antitermination NusG family protein [Gemmatimonadaceae bacterium]
MDRKFDVASEMHGLSWLLVYTKPGAESWAEINLRNQGFTTLMPRVVARGRTAPLFPRYVFVGCPAGARIQSLHSTFGILYVVQCGEQPARVPGDVLEEIRGRMNEHGVVHIDRGAPADELFARRERDRVRALVKFAQAGFRVRSA